VVRVLQEVGGSAGAHFPRVMVMPTLSNGALFTMVGVVPSGQIDSKADDMSLRLGPVQDVRFEPDNNASVPGNLEKIIPTFVNRERRRT
jgi:hypothetical protein